MGLLRRPTPGESWRADDWAGPTGRARYRAQSEKTCLRLRRPSAFQRDVFGHYLTSDLGSLRSSAAGSVHAWLGDLPPLAGLWVTARRRSGLAGPVAEPVRSVLEAERQVLTRQHMRSLSLPPPGFELLTPLPSAVSRPSGLACERVAAVRKVTTVIGVVLILALGLVATVGRPQPARAAGDSLVLVWNEETLESIRRLPPGPTVAAPGAGDCAHRHL
jgi:hypothetical protein